MVRIPVFQTVYVSSSLTNRKEEEYLSVNYVTGTIISSKLFYKKIKETGLMVMATVLHTVDY